tara:strand:- start:10616 stop:10882 length:267 start_codon:yes stop_codon:yes gene_type:complete
MVINTIEQAEREKSMPSPHYDVEKGSLSDDPSDLNHLKAITRQFQRGLEHQIKKITEDFNFLRGLTNRMVELSEKAHKKYENSDNDND